MLHTELERFSAWNIDSWEGLGTRLDWSTANWLCGHMNRTAWDRLHFCYNIILPHLACFDHEHSPSSSVDSASIGCKGSNGGIAGHRPSHHLWVGVKVPQVNWTAIIGRSSSSRNEEEIRELQSSKLGMVVEGCQAVIVIDRPQLHTSASKVGIGVMLEH